MKLKHLDFDQPRQNNKSDQLIYGIYKVWYSQPLQGQDKKKYMY